MPPDDDPRRVHHRVRLRHGDTVLVRTLLPDDRAGLGAMFDDLSNSSRYQRFLGGKPSVSPRALRRLTDVDHRDHEALVAVAVGEEAEGAADGGRVIGEARWIRDDDDRALAEMAITVADDWQQCGLGTALAHDLACRAVEEGIDRFTAEVLTDNSGIRKLVEHVGEVDRTDQDGATSTLQVSTAGRDGGAIRRALRSAASGHFLVVPRPLRWWLRLSGEITKTLMVPVTALLRRR